MKHFVKTLILIILTVGCHICAGSQEPITNTGYAMFDRDQFEADTKELVEDYEILFVINPEFNEIDLQKNLLEPNDLHRDFGIVVESDLTDYIEDSAMPDGVILIGSIWKSLQEAELSWIRAAYRQGVVIGLVNVTQSEVRELLDLRCSDMRLLNYNFRGHDFYMVTSLQVSAVFEEDRLAVIEAFERCGDEDDVNTLGPIHVTVGSAQNTLLDSYGGPELIATVGLHISMGKADEFSPEEQAQVIRQLHGRE